ncbi:MAG: hypothetical protein ACREDR_29035 [Blastocatellia bacterium]
MQGNGGTVSRLNLQCYSGGAFNNPGDWIEIGVPIVAGSSCINCGSPQTTCSPADMQNLFRLWRTGQGPVPPACCWSGTPNRWPQVIGGGFIYVYDRIKGKVFFDYMNAVYKGLGGD